MADPLLIAAYAAAKFIEKGNREEAARKLAEKERQEKEAKAVAEQRVQEYGRYFPDGPITLLNPVDKRYKDAKITHRRFGTGEIKEVPKEAKTVPLYRAKSGQIGTQDFFNKNIVSQFGKMGTLEDFGLTAVGSRDITGNTYKDNFYPEFLSPKAEKQKDVVVAQGTIMKDGKPQPVYANTIAELEANYPSVIRPGQVKVPKPFAEGLNLRVDALSTELKSFVTQPKTEKEPRTPPFVGFKDGNEIYGTRGELEAQGATNIGQATFDWKDSKPIRTGPIKFLEKETAKKVSNNFVDAYSLDENGKRTGPVKPVPLFEYQQSPEKFEATSDNAYQLDPETKERKYNIPLQRTSASGLKGKLERSNSPFDIDFKDANGDNQVYFVEKEYKTPLLRLETFRNSFLSKLPTKEDGGIDWNKAGIQNQLPRILNYAAGLIEQNTTIVDKDTGERVPSKQLLADNIQFLRSSYPMLTQIPGLEQEVEIRAGLRAREAQAALAADNRVSVDGSPQDVIVASTPTSIPAQAIDPTASPDAPALPARINMAIPFDPKYRETVDFAIAALAPSGTETDINNAKNIFKSLVTFEYETGPNGQRRIKKGPNGQVVVSRLQPKLDFLDYLRKSKDTDDAPFFTTFQNMLKIGAERKVGNPNVETDVRVAFNNAFDGNFEDGMAIISAFSPSVAGTARDRLLWAAQNNKDSRLFSKERASRVQQADSAANAINQIDRMIQTYYTRDGKFIDINTSLGQFYVAADGAVHLFQQGMENVLPGLIPVTQDQAVNAARNTIFGTDRNGRTNFFSITQNQPANILDIAKQRGYDTVDAFLAAERTARQENVAAFDEAVKGLGSNNETVKNLALRNYYRFMVAYSMAAAIQGGTGGRTISDQDVQNILRALKMDSVFGQASTEVEILQAAKEMLVDIEKHSRAVGQGGTRAYAALKLQELSLGNRGTKITIDDVTDALEQPGSSVSEGGGTAAIPEMSDADKLKKINDAQGKFGDTYDSLEAATTALGAAGIARILSK